jgi:hypothetical protein
MTETSLLPKAAAAIGLDYAALCQRMVDLALRRESPATSRSHPHAAVPAGKETYVV